MFLVRRVAIQQAKDNIVASLMEFFQPTRGRLLACYVSFGVIGLLFAVTVTFEQYPATILLFLLGFSTYQAYRIERHRLSAEPEQSEPDEGRAPRRTQPDDDECQRGQARTTAEDGGHAEAFAQMTRCGRGDEVAAGEAGEDLAEVAVGAVELVSEVGPDRAERAVGEAQHDERHQPHEGRPLGGSGEAAGHRRSLPTRPGPC